MIANQIVYKRKILTKRYSNDQLAVNVHDHNDEPVAELSIMHNSVELAPNEFILKDYSENEDIAQELIESEQVTPTDRFVLIGQHLCPVCQISSEV